MASRALHGPGGKTTLRPFALQRVAGLAVALPLLGGLALASFFPLGRPGTALTAEKASRPSKEALRDLQRAAALLNAGQVEKGIEALEAVVASHPGDAGAEQAKALLLEYGVGDEVRVTLVDRTFFRNSMKITDRDILELAQSCLEDLRKSYARLTPYFQKSSVRLFLYDSQARYRQVTGFITASGNFTVTSRDDKKRTLEGKIEWHFPPTGMNPKDRRLRIKSLIHHEGAHYVTAVYFGGFVPQVINEGISTYLDSRLTTESYVGFRATERQKLESNARNALNAIAKYPDFIAMLEGERGFGKGDAMISRWYGLCYSIFDFLAEGEIDGKKGSFERVFAELDALAQKRAAKVEKGKPPPIPKDTEVLGHLVMQFYGASLERFHKALVDRVMKTYRRL